LFFIKKYDKIYIVKKKGSVFIMKINIELDQVDLLDVIVFGLEAKYGIKKISHQNIEIHLDEEGYAATIKNVMLEDLK
jgi:predicted cation transporter